MNAITASSGGGNGMIPTSMEGAIRLAEMMARGKLVPQHLQNSPGDCLMVIEQAMRFKMSPFAVAQCTSVISGKLMLEGKLVAAAVQSSGALDGRLSYDFTGEGDNRTITVKGRLRGEADTRDIVVKMKDAKTTNGMWVKQPDQQLVYFATRAWARRHVPEVMLGVYSPDEFDQPSTSAVTQFAGPTIEATPEPAPTMTAKPKVSEWLDALQRELDEATAADVVDEIVARPEVQRALDKLQNGARARLMEMIAGANARTAPPADDASGFPGDRP